MALVVGAIGIFYVLKKLPATASQSTTITPSPPPSNAVSIGGSPPNTLPPINVNPPTTGANPGASTSQESALQLYAQAQGINTINDLTTMIQNNTRIAGDLTVAGGLSHILITAN